MPAKAVSGKRAETHSLPFTGHKLWQVTCGQWQELTAGTCGIQLFKEVSDGRQEDPGTGETQSLQLWKRWGKEKTNYIISIRCDMEAYTMVN